jgi:hypothetical protein
MSPYMCYLSLRSIQRGLRGGGNLAFTFTLTQPSPLKGEGIKSFFNYDPGAQYRLKQYILNRHTIYFVVFTFDTSE